MRNFCRLKNNIWDVTFNSFAKLNDMKKFVRCAIISLFSFVSTNVFAQNFEEKNFKMQSVFEKLTNELKDYKPDTANAPNDKITKEIIKLRALRGGFNINEAIEYKLAEEKQKAEVPAADLEKLSTFFKTGNGKRWLDNAVTSIYRQHFTYKELKQLTKFYRTAAGRKMAADFPFIMMKSLVAGEAVKSFYTTNSENKIIKE